jgi:glutamate synthase (ferredoxin)
MMALAMGASAAGVQPRVGVRARAVSGRRSTVRVAAMQKVSRDSFAVKSGVDAPRAACSVNLRKASALPKCTSVQLPGRATTVCLAEKGSVYGDWPLYQGGAVDNTQLLEEHDACGVGFIASLKGERTHKTVADSLTAVGCMEHRGACSADNDSGDGVGVMTHIPWKLLGKWCDANGISGFAEGSSAVGQCMLPTDASKAAEAKKILEASCVAEGLKVLGWREVPVDNSVVGPLAKMTCPKMEQILVDGSGMDREELERKLFIARKTCEKTANVDAELAESFYICTLSSRTIVYKGMLRSAVLGKYYKDLEDPDYESQFSIYHRRFSTNTTPKWPLSQPMRFLGHNGEINTLQGNLNWMASKEADMENPVWGGREPDFRPICNPAASDSANLDRVAELLVRTGRAPDETMMLLVPEAHRNHPELDATFPEVHEFYDYYAGMQEAWDGPALLVFSDGKQLGARLDRNGLRPARFWRTSDDYIYVASEVGVLGDVMSNAANVTAKGRLGPGMMILADLETGEFKENTEIAKDVAGRRPYGDWMKSIDTVSGVAPVSDTQLDPIQLIESQARAGYAAEDITMIIESMAADAIEPTWSMGDDTPMPVLSGRPRMLYDYFKQRFAQVTNPAIDPLREGLVMSLEMTLGAKGNLLDTQGKETPPVRLESPVIFDSELEHIKNHPKLKTATVPARYASGGAAGALKAGLDKMCEEAAAAIRAGSQCVVITDRPDQGPDSPAIPSLLAVGTLHHYLIAQGLRSRASIVVESASAFSTHHMAMLIGYGAHAICPWLALETCRSWRKSPKIEAAIQRGKMGEISVEGVQNNFKAALNKGLKKILSKMGISMITSYQGAQIFECYGLGPEVINTAFKGTVSRIGGLTLDEVAGETHMFIQSAFPGEAEEMAKVEARGMFQVKPGLEYHGNNQEMSKLLHKAVGLGGDEKNDEFWSAYQAHRNDRPFTCLRDQLEIKSDRQPISIDEVESVADICTRFCTGGMSLGAISQECHESIAIAMNRIGGKSNSGEGGEDPKRFEQIKDAKDGKSDTFPYLRGLENGDVASSAIKQVASGRFGVTTSFLMSANQTEIKVAQGAKPGEGGQLPGKKVSPYIAWLRRSKAGVPLISPPPHHDIYSIEDLAQLIYDLHMVNKDSKVSVKLVSQAGIGTVASGVAKANADIIQISGGDGGTGASPLSSIKHCGGPLEMGLVESHRTLVENGLRERVVLRADGGCRSGLDVIQTALMGADEYGFGTVAMIATGCVMARICHTNNCPVGVASQREELRARFPGAPSDLVNFFMYAAQEVREILAQMGYRSLDEIIGRNDLLSQVDSAPSKTKSLDLSFLTTSSGEAGASSDRIAQPTHNDGYVLDDKILEDAEVIKCIESEGTYTKKVEIINTDRCATARVAGQIAKKYGDNGFAGSLTLDIEGSSGQSFGAFVVGGMKVRLVGEANDYVAKSMSGGEIAIMPPANSPFAPEGASIAGNACLYGATGGQVFINGRAGERFAVRNSLGEAVVEGTGDHCCEYMTGGCVVALGKVGRNVGAGMTGGLGYFLDEDGSFQSKVNGEIVIMQRVITPAGEAQLKGLITAHAEKTGSPKAKAILADWANYLPKFWQLVPPSEANTPEATNDATAPDAVAKTA